MSDQQYPELEACGNLIRTKRTEDGSGGWLVGEFHLNCHGTASLSAERFVRCWNTHDGLVARLRECRATLEMWKDVAPAVSLCADIDRDLAAIAEGARD